MAPASAPRLPPSVAPMNRDGEKIPPEAPEPRLRSVAASLQTNSRNRKAKLPRPPSSTAWIVA